MGWWDDSLVSLDVARDLVIHASWDADERPGHLRVVASLVERRRERREVTCAEDRYCEGIGVLYDEYAPDGQVGLERAQVCTISFGGVSETYLPLTPPPNSAYSVSGFAADYMGPSVSESVHNAPESVPAQVRASTSVSSSHQSGWRTGRLRRPGTQRQRSRSSC